MIQWKKTENISSKAFIVINRSAIINHVKAPLLTLSSTMMNLSKTADSHYPYD